jgi:hypothetical protein
MGLVTWLPVEKESQVGYAMVVVPGSCSKTPSLSSIASHSLSLVLLLLARIVFSSEPEQVQEMEQLMALHQYWDAWFLLTELIRTTKLGRFALLRARCLLKLGQYERCLTDALAVLGAAERCGSPRLSIGHYHSDLTLQFNDADGIVREATSILAEALPSMGEYEDLYTAAERMRNAALSQEMETLSALKAQAGRRANANAHEFKEAVRLYDLLAVPSPKWLPILLRRLNLTALARDDARYPELAINLTRQFPSNFHVTASLGRIAFCNCSFNEAAGYEKSMKIRLAETKRPEIPVWNTQERVKEKEKVL